MALFRCGIPFCSANFPEHFAQMLAKVAVQQTFLAALRYKYNVVLQPHFEWFKFPNSSIQFLLVVCLAAHDTESLGGLPNMSNFFCLPGRAGGTPDWISSLNLFWSDLDADSTRAVDAMKKRM